MVTRVFSDDDDVIKLFACIISINYYINNHRKEDNLTTIPNASSCITKSKLHISLERFKPEFLSSFWRDG